MELRAGMVTPHSVAMPEAGLEAFFHLAPHRLYSPWRELFGYAFDSPVAVLACQQRSLEAARWPVQVLATNL